jgi:digeranylgeranylglycerophospholipid reductase
VTLEQRELVIVGAGPAGSVAAREAALAGRAPLLVERAAAPGQGNACGGLLADAFRRKLDLPDEVVEHSIRRTVLRVDGEVTLFEGRRPRYITTRRALLDAHLARRAEAAGAELLTSTRARVVDPSRGLLRLRRTTDGHEREVAAGLLIFADGPRTAAAGALGIGHRPRRRTWYAVVHELEGRFGDGETIEMLMDTGEGTPGYGWLFPNRDRSNVGAGGPRFGSALSWRQRLERMLEARADMRGRRVLSRNAGMIPVQRARRLVTDGALVVGDAGGLVNPFTGGGLAFAILSGEIAGRVAARALDAGRADRAALQPYAARLRRTPQYTWMVLMDRLMALVEARPPALQAPLYAALLRRYLALFNSAQRVIERILGA